MVARCISLVAALTLAFAVPATAQDKPYATDIAPVTVAAGSIGGSWFIITTAFFDLFSRNIEGLSYTIVPGGAITNPIAVDKGMSPFAMGYTTMLHAAQNGDAPFDHAMPDFRGIANINVAGVLHAFVLENSGLTSWRDIAAQQYGLSVDTGPRGTGGELAASRALELYGAGYDNLNAWGGSITHSNYREAIGRMKDGHIEAFINDDIVGNPTFVDLALSRDVVLLPLDPDVQQSMIEKFGYAEAVIPAHTYRGQETDIPSTAQHFVLFGHKDLPEELIYAMTRLIFENKDDLVATHQLFSDLDPVVGPMHFPIPLHPGAARYYNEIGVLD